MENKEKKQSNSSFDLDLDIFDIHPAETSHSSTTTGDSNSKKIQTGIISNGQKKNKKDALSSKNSSNSIDLDFFSIQDTFNNENSSNDLLTPDPPENNNHNTSLLSMDTESFVSPENINLNSETIIPVERSESDMDLQSLFNSSPVESQNEESNTTISDEFFHDLFFNTDDDKNATNKNKKKKEGIEEEIVDSNLPLNAQVKILKQEIKKRDKIIRDLKEKYEFGLSEVFEEIEKYNKGIEHLNKSNNFQSLEDFEAFFFQNQKLGKSIAKKINQKIESLDSFFDNKKKLKEAQHQIVEKLKESDNRLKTSKLLLLEFEKYQEFGNQYRDNNEKIKEIEKRIDLHEEIDFFMFDDNKPDIEKKRKELDKYKAKKEKLKENIINIQKKIKESNVFSAFKAFNQKSYSEKIKHDEKEQERKKANFKACFLCPITQEVMKEPVILEESQQTYEKTAIETWLKNKKTDPVTNMKVKSTKTIPNIALKSAILEWKKNNEEEAQSYKVSFDQKIQYLIEMGFKNEARDRRLLKEMNGDLEEVTKVLVRESKEKDKIKNTDFVNSFVNE